jgi:hypothetical protein
MTLCLMWSDREWRCGTAVASWTVGYLKATSARDWLWQRINYTGPQACWWVGIIPDAKALVFDDTAPLGHDHACIANGLTAQQVYHEIETYMLMLSSQGGGNAGT